MNTLIVYAGKSGTCEEMVERMAARLDGNVVRVNVKKDSVPDPAEFDRVIVGGSIYAGSLNKKVSGFCTSYEETLLARQTALFLCSLREEDTEENFARSFPERLRKSAAAEAWLGGRFIFSQHNFVIRGMMKKIMGTDEDADTTRPEEADRLVSAISNSATA